MDSLQDRAYFAGRAAKAHVLATAATDPGIRQIHLDRAKRYDDLARSVSPPLQALRSQTLAEDKFGQD